MWCCWVAYKAGLQTKGSLLVDLPACTFLRVVTFDEKYTLCKCIFITYKGSINQGSRFYFLNAENKQLLSSSYV